MEDKKKDPSVPANDPEKSELREDKELFNKEEGRKETRKEAAKEDAGKEVTSKEETVEVSENQSFFQRFKTMSLKFKLAILAAAIFGVVGFIVGAVLLVKLFADYSNSETVNVRVSFKDLDSKYLEVSYLQIDDEQKKLSELITNYKAGDDLPEEVSITVPMEIATEKVVFESYLYADQEAAPEFARGGENKLSFTAIPAADFNLHVTELLTGEAVVNAVVKVANTSEESVTELEFQSDDRGILTVEDLVVEHLDTYTLTASGEGYLSKSLEIKDLELQQGQKEETIEISIPPTVKVAYLVEASNGRSIYEANLDGSGVKRLTDKGIDTKLIIDQEDGLIYFESDRESRNYKEGDNPWNLYSVKFGGESLQRISPLGYADGKGLSSYDIAGNGRVSWTSNPYYSLESEYKMSYGKLNSKESKVIKTLTYGQVDEFLPSPDGKKLVLRISSIQNAEFVTGVYSMNTDGSNFKLLYNNADKNYVDIQTITPDGKYLLMFVSMPGGTEWKKIDVTTGETENLSFLSIGNVRYSPDSSNFAYFANRNGKQDIFVRAKDGEETRITDTGMITSFYWSDKETIIYVKENSLYAVNIKHPEKAVKIVDEVFAYAYGEYYYD